MLKKRSLTNRGAALSGGAFAMIVSGLLTADGFFILLGISGLLLTLCCYILGKANLAQLKPNIYLHNKVVCRRTFEIEISLHNQRRLLDAFDLQIHVALMGQSVFAAHAPWTAANHSSRITLQGSIPRRGYTDNHQVELSSQFPLGLFQLKKRLTIQHEMKVTPNPIIPLELNQHGSLQDALPHFGLSNGKNFGEPRGIRAWQAGDSARHIHWPASARAMARGHDLRIREYDPPGFHPDNCHIIFHSYASGREMLREDRFERALSLLAGTLTELQGKGIPCTLSTDFLSWEPFTCHNRKQMTDFLTILTKIQRSRDTESHDLDHAIRTTSPEQAVIVISDMTPDSWAHNLAKHPNILFIDIRQVRYQHRILHAASA